MSLPLAVVVNYRFGVLLSSLGCQSFWGCGGISFAKIGFSTGFPKSRAKFCGLQICVLLYVGFLC